jgi:hypothetical protein
VIDSQWARKTFSRYKGNESTAVLMKLDEEIESGGGRVVERKNAARRKASVVAVANV